MRTTFIRTASLRYDILQIDQKKKELLTRSILTYNSKEIKVETGQNRVQEYGQLSLSQK